VINVRLLLSRALRRFFRSKGEGKNVSITSPERRNEAVLKGETTLRYLPINKRRGKVLSLEREKEMNLRERLLARISPRLFSVPFDES